MPLVTPSRRLVLPALVLLTLTLPVAAAPGHVQDVTVVPPEAAAGPRGLLRLAVSDATPVELPAPAVAVRPAAATAGAVSSPQAPQAATPVARRASRARESTAEFRPGWEARRGHLALELISYRWRDLGWQISFHPARRGLLGLAHGPDRHIYIFVRRSQSIRSLAFTIAHEIGHAYDFTHGTRESHNRWLELRGIDAATPWFGCNGCGDLETPAGDFAEVFAVWQIGPVDFRSRIAPLPQGERLRVLSREFLAAGSASAA